MARSDGQAGSGKFWSDREVGPNRSNILISAVRVGPDAEEQGAHDDGRNQGAIDGLVLGSPEKELNEHHKQTADDQNGAHN
jgi:hypothetical protein